MIIVKLMGGLGNQMFQYACARHLAERNNDILKLDLTWYQPGGIAEGDTIRSYALEQFSITALPASEEEIRRLRGSQSVVAVFMRRAIRKIVHTIRPVMHHVFDPKVLLRKGDVYLDEFFQSERYFKDIDPIIRNEFRLKNAMSGAAQVVAQNIEQTNAVSLHVRRGDYVTNNNASAFLGVCSPEYYRAAIDEIGSRVDSPKFFVFSDDIEWVKGHIEIPFPVAYISNGDIADYAELVLMSKCKHNIIANSSFSWWGAWLNVNPNKTVIAPRSWFNDPSAHTTSPVPSEWITL